MKSFFVVRSILVAAAILTPASLTAANFTVTNTNDLGAGSLRQAITDANGSMGPDIIDFNIPGTGPHTIAPVTTLPAITQPVTIDGYTEQGASANTNPVGQGLDTVLMIEIDGTNFTPTTACLRVQASDVTIKGLVVNRCGDGNISLVSGAFSNARIEGNFLGTNVIGTGLYTQGSGGNIEILGQSGATIGGTTPAARNLLSGCHIGIDASGPGSGHVIQGNLIGLDISGTAALPECTGTSFAAFVNTGGSSFTFGGTAAGTRNVIAGTSNGIVLRGSNHIVQGNLVGTDITGTVRLGFSAHGIQLEGTGILVGGSAPGAGNVIGGADFYSGIEVAGSGHTIQGNSIGTDPTGTLNLGNSRIGIQISTTANADVLIGGPNPGEGNVIAFNGGSFNRNGGIGISSGSGITIRGNRIYTNRSVGIEPGLGVDLANSTAAVTPNDFGDADTGVNNLQNFPIITSAAPNAPVPGGTQVQGVLHSAPSTSYTLDFYGNACVARPQEYLEGQTYLGSAMVTTDGGGTAAFDVSVPVAIQAGDKVTATATDPAGNTSEFSPRMVFSISPKSGPAAGGTTLTLTGTDFLSGASVTVGGTPATSVSVNGFTSIAATTPARPAGTVNDVTVTNTDGSAGTLPNGWVADFNDVPGSHLFYQFVTRLVANAITAGCGGGNYCPDTPVTRAQMAVFLLRGKNGVCYFPPPATGTVFGDVAANSFAAAWIEALSEQKVTAGCGGGNYCPTSPVTRAQMAVFLLRTLNGPTYAPPACTTPTFADVSCGSPFAPWIEDLVDRGITAGCGGGNYCPDNANTRGQMSVFISTTFSLP